ncbi:MAG: glycosyltransferase family 2 protein [Candidatus Pacearchaeota archaeon]|jgi:glycosyltransferase involved in cell wall biosynthesis
MEKPYYSVVIPIYNEEGNTKVLDKEIKEVMNSLKKPYEIIYINDGSTDNTFKELKALSKVTILNLNRNYGQATALDAGFKRSKGEIIISLDGDLQNDPKDIPKLLEKLEKDNLDVVAGWRKFRKDKSGIKILTRIGRLMRKVLIKDPVHDTGCTLRVYKREAIKNLDISGEMHRYILALLRWKGFKIGEIIVNHRPRTMGKTKYGYKKALRGFIDLIYVWFIDKFSQRPLHIFGSAGILSFFLGFLALGLTLYQKIVDGLGLNRNGWFFIGFFLIISGIILFSFGIVIDLLMKIHLNTSPFEKRYTIRDIIE